MNAVDIFLAFLILLSTFIGYRYGALRLIAEFLKWTVAATLAVLFYTVTVEEILKQLPQLSTLYLPLSFSILFIISYLLLSLIQRLLFNGAASVHLADKITGIVPGLLTGILLSAVAARLFAVSVVDEISREVSQSRIAAALSPYSIEAETAITPFVTGYLAPVLTNHLPDKNNDSRVFATNRFSVRPDLESQMLVLVNAERKKVGLKLLTVDEPLKKVARAHSADMLTRGYFAHQSPEGTDPFARMKQAGISYKHAGENLAYAPTLAAAHKGLMKSPSHRAAILSKSFGRIGIGIVDGGKNGLMISQEFRD
jgi:uncharacterized protein YkwD